MLLGRVGDQVLKGVHIIDNELMLLTFENALAFQLVKIGGHIGTMHIHNGSHVCEGWELVDEDAAIWLWLAVVGGKGQKEGVDLVLGVLQMIGEGLLQQNTVAGADHSHKGADVVGIFL